MEKIDNLQLELFSAQKQDADLNAKRFSGSFLRYIHNYEKAILITVGFIITAILSFSIGVEKGKGIQPRESVATNIKSQTAVKIEKTGPVQKLQDKQYINNYTVQVASFKNKTAANKELEALKKKGLSPLIMPKGKYMVVCVGKFSNPGSAEMLLSQLKKLYKDCLIRRL